MRKVNRLSQHVDYEDLFIGLINLTYDLNFVNINKKQQNTAGIDALDTNNGLVLQITSDTTAGKVISSLKKANRHKWYLKGEHFKMAYLKDKKPFTSKSVSTIDKSVGGFKHSANDDVYTADKIYQSLVFSKNMVKIRKVIQLLDDYIGYLPKFKSSGFTSIALCFCDSDNLDTVFLLTEQLLREE